MQIKMFFAVFAGVFLAELGDKTQLATMLFASDREISRIGVFLASSAALVCSSLLAVLVGSQIDRFLSPQFLKIAAGLGFILIGAWFFWSGLKA
ncbi:MAG: TMEM165/GDT1 family protein [Thermodesulfobacteriota bacterium]|nr:TMEM165/GDT1 family protein [Thermodesulfobacteriota bacterium]